MSSASMDASATIGMDATNQIDFKRMLLRFDLTNCAVAFFHKNTHNADSNDRRDAASGGGEAGGVGVRAGVGVQERRSASALSYACSRASV